MGRDRRGRPQDPHRVPGRRRPGRRVGPAGRQTGRRLETRDAPAAHRGPRRRPAGRRHRRPGRSVAGDPGRGPEERRERAAGPDVYVAERHPASAGPTGPASHAARFLGPAGPGGPQSGCGVLYRLELARDRPDHRGHDSAGLDDQERGHQGGLVPAAGVDERRPDQRAAPPREDRQGGRREARFAGPRYPATAG